MASADDPTEITRRFTVGGVLSDSLSLLGRWPVEFIGLFVVMAVPQVVFELGWNNWLLPMLQSTTEMRAGASLIAGELLLTAVAAGVIDILARAAITVAVSDSLSGAPPDLGRCLHNVVSALPRLTIVGLLFGLGIGVPTALCVFLAAHGVIDGQALILGTIVSVVVLLIVAIIWLVQVPVLLLEAARPIASFGRSFVLMSNHGFTIFGLLLVIGTPKVGIHWMLASGLDKSGVLYQITDDSLDCLYWFALAVAATISYYRLRAQKEGVVIGDIAQVFD